MFSSTWIYWHWPNSADPTHNPDAIILCADLAHRFTQLTEAAD